MRHPSCYTASKMEHREQWIKLRRTATDIYWTAHWPDIECSSNPDLSKMFWQRDLNDIARSDFVLVYAEDEFEQLRGALVEAGMGIALGKVVIVVGESHCYGTWQYHPHCLKAVSIEEAIWMMNTLSAEEHVENDYPTRILTRAEAAALQRPARAPFTSVDSLDDEIPF